MNSLQREIFNSFPTSNNNKLRYIMRMLRSKLSRPDNRRAMVFGGTKISHKCIRAQGSQISHNALHIKGKRYNTVSVHMRMDHMTALSYLMKMWGIKNQELTAISKEIWQYLLKRKFTITAEFLPGSMNPEADRESRQTRNSSEWKLNPTIFMKLCQIRETSEMDLFASRVSHQLPQYISSHGNDALQIS